MKCPVCGGATLILTTKDVQYIYKGQKTIIKDVTGEHCSACDEVLLDREHGDQYAMLIGAFQQDVEAASVDSGGGPESPS